MMDELNLEQTKRQRLLSSASAREQQDDDRNMLLVLNTSEEDTGILIPLIKPLSRPLASNFSLQLSSNINQYPLINSPTKLALYIYDNQQQLLQG